LVKRTISSSTWLFDQTTLTYSQEYLTDSLSSYTDYKILIILAERISNGSFVVEASNCTILADYTTKYDAQHIFVLSGINSNSSIRGKGYGTDYYHRTIIGLN
jgi:hypothetical protein